MTWWGRPGWWAALALAGGCFGSPAGPDGGSARVLFIGNSLTYVNDLPGTVAAVARAAGDSLVVGSVAGPNLALIDHLDGATEAPAVIGRGGWSHVVLQQGPTPAGICRDTLVLAAGGLGQLIRQQGGRPLLLMTWVNQRRPGMLDETYSSHRAAADAAHGAVIPAGYAWNKALTVRPDLPLYGTDGYHPAPVGTLLTALVVYEAISGHDARAIDPAALRGAVALTLDAPTVSLLEAAAHAAAAPRDTVPAGPLPPGAGQGPC